MNGVMPSLLEQLKKMTVVVADTGDMNSMKKFTPRDATTNPSLITAAAQMPEYQSLVDDALLFAKREAGPGASKEVVAGKAIESLSVEFGLRSLKILPGPVPRGA